jgi:hypothetical protein
MRIYAKERTKTTGTTSTWLFSRIDGREGSTEENFSPVTEKEDGRRDHEPDPSKVSTVIGLPATH